MSTFSLGAVGTSLKQCQNCHKSETSEFHLQSCAGCKRSHYCCKACQLADWPNHKLICKTNRETRSRMRSNKQESHAAVSNAPSAKDVEDRLKRWIQIHRPMLHYAIIHALKLQVTPDRCLTHVLFLSLVSNFPGGSATHSSSLASLTTQDIATSFHISETNVYASSDIPEILASQVSAGLAQYRERTLAIRRKGGVGIPLMIIDVPAVGLRHITPLGCEDSLNEADWPLNTSWEKDLREMVRKGRTF